MFLNSKPTIQVLVYKYQIYIVVFEPRYEEPHSFRPEAVDQLEILLIGRTSDAMLTIEGFWQVLGNHTVKEERLLFPNNKVQTLDGFMKTDFDGNIIGKATEEELKYLTYEKSFTPGVFESAFKAYHKLKPWEERFNSLLYSNVKKTIR